MDNTYENMNQWWWTARQTCFSKHFQQRGVLVKRGQMPPDICPTNMRLLEETRRETKQWEVWLLVYTYTIVVMLAECMMQWMWIWGWRQQKKLLMNSRKFLVRGVNFEISCFCILAISKLYIHKHRNIYLVIVAGWISHILIGHWVAHALSIRVSCWMSLLNQLNPIREGKGGQMLWSNHMSVVLLCALNVSNIRYCVGRVSKPARAYLSLSNTQDKGTLPTSFARLTRPGLCFWLYMSSN